jgi:hypothetical protein
MLPQKLSDVKSDFRAPAILSAIWPRLIEAWMVVLLLAFFVIRILGSSVGQRFLAHLGHRHAG